MIYQNLKELGSRLYFTVKDAADILRVKPESAWVLCARYVKEGIFLRVRKNFYVLSQKWESFSREDFFRISNFLQVPSYVSFMTALSWYEVTTQVQRNFFESASLKRSLQYETEGVAFNFYKLQKEYYFDFIKKNNVFMATKEKAFLDSIYLYSFGKYRLDMSSLDLEKLDKIRMKRLMRPFPQKTQKIISKLCRI